MLRGLYDYQWNFSPLVIFPSPRTGVASVGFVGFPSVGKVCSVSLTMIPFLLTTISVDAHVKVVWYTFRGV